MARSNTLYSVASGARTRLVDRVLWHKLRLVVALLCVIGALFHNGAVALAAGITVTTTADIIDAGANCAAVTLAALPGPGGQTSLREAICAANNTPGADTISFSVNGTFALTGPANDDAGNSGDLDVTDSVTIQGNGAANTIIDGSGNERIFDVYPGAPIMFTVNGLTIQNGDTRSTSFQLGGAIYLHSNVTTSISASQIINNFSGANGAIDNVGTLTISNSVIANNQTIPAAGTVTGGGLRNAGALTISNSTIANNTVRGEGGGIATTTGSGVVVNITNTTISGNTASVTGGGLGNGGGISTTGNDGIINITNSTISGNRADNNGGGAYFTTPTVTGAFNLTNVTINNNTADNDNNGSGVGGGFRLNAGSATLYNTIVAGNFNSTAATRDDINGTVSASSSNNLIGDGTGAAGITNGLNGNQVGSGGSPINPLLGPLANTGGSTETHALLAGSPAIDTASSSFCPATDQRGIPRPGGAACDIGAYELNDITPPDTTLTSFPTNPSSSSNASFGFTGSDTGGSGLASFQCKIDSGSYTTCTSPRSYTSLPDGSHTFMVRAVDGAGNIDPTPASYTWIIDATPPNTSIISTPPNLSASTAADFTFSGNDGGGTGVASFECRLDSGTFAACTSPHSYTGLSQSSHTFQVRAVDTLGQTDPTPASYTWVIDATAPDTTITSSPANPSNSASATFSFSGSDPGGTGVVSFECRLDGAAFAACTSPQSYIGLADGTHTFEVRAIDAAANVDATPASYTWVIDATAPDTTITANPTNPTSSANASFSFIASDNGGSGVASFECRLDGAAFAACTSTQTYSSLADGTHTFQVRAIDTLGNIGISASYTWVVDTTGPDTTITAGPSNPSNSASATFSFSGNDGGGTGVASFECRLDGAAFAACTSPQSYTGLADGSHTFEVRAIDAAANVDATPASYTWAIDATAPSATFSSVAPDPTNTSPIPVTVTFSENVSGFTAADLVAGNGSVNNFAGSGSVYTFDLVPAGQGLVTVDIAAGVAQDSAGNGNSAATQFNRTYDSVAPTVTINQAAGQADPTGASPIDFTVVFNEPVTGFGDSAADVTIGGTAGATTATVSGSGTTYTVAITGMTGTGTVVVSIPAGAAQDLGTNPNAASTSTDSTVDYDPVVPVATGIVRADPSPTSAASVQFTVTFSKNVTGVDAGDFALSTAGITGASITGVSGSGTTWTVTVNTGSGDGTLRLDLVDDDSITDNAGNALGGSGAANGDFSAGQAYTIDKTAPNVVSIVRAGPNPTNASSVDFTLTTSESVTGVDLSDFGLTTSGTLTATSLASVSGSGTTWTITVNTGSGDGTLRLDLIDDDSIVDNVGNALGGAGAQNVLTGEAYTIDRTGPDVTIDQAVGQNDPADTAPIRFTAIFGEAVTGFDAADVAIAGTAPGSLSAAIAETGPLDGTTYMVSISGMTGSGTVIVTVPANAASDMAGNGNNTSTGTDNTVTFVPSAPVVTGIVASGTNPTNAASVSFQVTFSEGVIGVDESDFALAPSGISGASITGVSGNGATWTVTVGTGSGDGTLGLNLVDDDSITSALTGIHLGDSGAGNGNFTGQQYAIDRTAPGVTSVNAVNVTAGAAATYTFIVTYADNLAIDASTLGNGDVIVSGPHGFSQPATLVAVDVAGDGSPRSATYSITAPGGTWDGTDNGSYAISVVAGGIADTASNLIAATQAGSFTVGVAYSIALPLVVSPIPVPAQLPDLVVESITTTGGSVQIVLRNQGTAPVGNGFWVDVYVNPDRAPTRVNETWNIVGTQGLVWGVTESIPAGGSLTLNVGDRFYHADASFVSGPISSGTTLYVQADSADTATSYGAVLESHEVAGAPYNNILGPVKAETTIRIAGQATGSQSPGLLPGRPKR